MTDTPSKSRFQHILVPTDFGEASARALDLAVDLANQYGASVTLLHTYEVPVYAYPGAVSTAADLLGPIRAAAEKRLDEELVSLRKRTPKAGAELCLGSAWQEILRKVEDKGATLVVMGTHGRTGVPRALLGSVAEKIVRTSPVPVLTVH